MSWGKIELRYRDSKNVFFDGEASPAPGGGSIADAVALDPADSTRNVMTVPLNVRGLTIDASAGSDTEPPQFTPIAAPGNYVAGWSVGDWDTATVYGYIFLDAGGEYWLLAGVPKLNLNDVLRLDGTDLSNIFGSTALAADGALQSSQFSLALDDTPGATKLLIKATDSGGTVRTGSVSLT